MPSSNIADRLPPLALALGDPAGVGPEIAAKAWERRASEGLLPFFVVGDVRSIEAVWSGPIARISDPSEAWEAFGTALPLIQLEDAGDGEQNDDRSSNINKLAVIQRPSLQPVEPAVERSIFQVLHMPSLRNRQQA